MKYSYYNALSELTKLFWAGKITAREKQDAELILFFGE